MYEPSTRNVRIESWWRQLRSGASDRWISFFNELAEYALFIEGNTADQIALYAIYAPLIQDEFADFVHLWNGHKIRTQRNRDHVLSGIPADLYRTQDARNWGIPLGTEDNAADRTALRTMLDPLESIDIDRFLVLETEEWCTKELESLGFSDRTLKSHTRPYMSYYLALRERIQIHQDSGQQPILELCPIQCSEWSGLSWSWSGLDRQALVWSDDFWRPWSDRSDRSDH